MKGLRLYNSLTRKVEEFKPIDPPNVGIYSCGPTVYWNQHIGHMYAYIHWDVLVRHLRSSGYKVKWVMNITDVGHLTSDEDDGEDKLEKGAKREGMSVWEVADKYIKQFLESITLLKISKPDVLSRATKHIDEQIELNKKIEKRGFAYMTKLGLVFDTSKFPKYAEFANLKLEKQKAGARVKTDSEKKNPSDFLLWVTNQPDHIMKWDSPWGKGFPGWHIECTAMSTKYLGNKFDIHTGGREHIPVHHTNEIAQSFGAFGSRTVNYWLHNNWLTLKGEKMSKSLGNIYTIADLVKKGYDPMAFRYLVLTSHYRKGIVFDWDAMDAAQKALENITKKIAGYDKPEIGCAKFEEDFRNALDNDINTPQALAVMWDMVKSDYPSSAKHKSLLKFDEILGLGLGKASKSKQKIPSKIKRLVKEREALRKGGKFSKADKIRDKIESLGYNVEDGGKGPKIEKITQ